MQPTADLVLSDDDLRAIEAIAERFQSSQLTSAERSGLVEELERIAERYAGDCRFFE